MDLHNFSQTMTGAQPGQEATPTGEPRHRIRTVLIVDDDPRVREALHALIGQSLRPAAIVEASSPAEALHRDELHHPDLVVLDLLLPEASDGLALLRDLAGRRRRVVAISMQASLGPSARECGAIAFVEKGAGLERVLRELETPEELGTT